MKACLNRSSSRRQALLAERARSMLANPPEAERVLWQCLRSGQLGAVFRRQVVIGERFVADFCAAAARVIVECDGPYHARRQRADARRDAWLARRGYRVVRVDAELVLRDLTAAVARIRARL